MKQRRLFAVLAGFCILMILAYTSIVFLPHAHECTSMGCSVCAVIETSRNLLLGIALFAVACLSMRFCFAIHNTHSYIEPIRDGTPVGLKVKLSD